MANSKTQWLEQRVLLKALKNTDFTIAAVYVGLTVAGVEPVGNAYARVGPLVAASWSAPADDGQNGMESHYTVDVLFPKAVGGAWGLIDGFFLADAAAAGNKFYADAVAPATTINENDQFKIDANSLAVHEA